MSDELPEYVAYAMARDERLRNLAASIEMEVAQRDGAAFRLLVDAIEEDGKLAAAALAECNPADMGSISAYQAQVRTSRIISDCIKTIIQRGQQAEASLRDDADMRDNG
jgi:hypothetical protein